MTGCLYDPGGYWNSTSCTVNTAQTVWLSWTSAASNTCDSTWNGWVQYDYGTSAASTNYVWRTWNDSCAWHNTNGVYRPAAPAIVRTPSRSELRRREKQRRKSAAKKQIALRAAERLLLEHLSQEQAEQYREEKKFAVITEEGRRYEIDCGKRMHNVFEVDEAGRHKVEHCIYQQGQNPLPDNVLAQKLLLEADEPAFRRIANQSRLIG